MFETGIRASMPVGYAKTSYREKCVTVLILFLPYYLKNGVNNIIYL